MATHNAFEVIQSAYDLRFSRLEDDLQQIRAEYERRGSAAHASPDNIGHWIENLLREIDTPSAPPQSGFIWLNSIFEDAATGSQQGGDAHWVTINGAHILIGGEGEGKGFNGDWPKDKEIPLGQGFTLDGPHNIYPETAYGYEEEGWQRFYLRRDGRMQSGHITASAENNGNSLAIRVVILPPELQKHSLGFEMYKAVANVAREAGFRELVSDPEAGTKPEAAAIWRKLGATENQSPAPGEPKFSIRLSHPFIHGPIRAFETMEEYQAWLLEADDSDGAWVTINGEHVFISSATGTVTKGPAKLIGKHRTMIGAGIYRATSVTDVSKVPELFSHPAVVKFEGDIGQIAHGYPEISVDKTSHAAGVWEGDREPSFLLEGTASSTVAVDALAVDIARAAPEAQRAMVTFIENPNGKGFAYELRGVGSSEKAVSLLLQNGFHGQTVPLGQDRIVLFDHDGSLRDNVSSSAQSLGARITETRGDVHFIEENDYQATRARYKTAAQEAEILHRNTAQELQEAEVDGHWITINGVHVLIGGAREGQTYYHGTTENALGSISKTGLQPTEASKFKFRINVGDYMRDRYVNMETSPGFVYITNDLKAAQWYAGLKAKMARAEPGSTFSYPEGPSSKFTMAIEKPEGTAVDRHAKGVVVRMNLPDSFKVETDPESNMGFKSFRVTSVPAEYITSKFGRPRLESITEAGEEDGNWVTLNGVHVFISAESGRISKGPKNLMGARPSLLSKAYMRHLEPGQTTEEAYRDPVTGKFDPKRAAYHQEVINQFEQGKNAPIGRAPIAVILGGGTASGKTTASRAILGANPDAVRIDPDEIKLDIPEYAGLKESDPQHAAFRVHEESSYLTKLIAANVIDKRLDLTYDSTTSGNSGLKMAKYLVSQGYDVRVLFVDIPIPEAIRRSNLRALTSTDPMNLGRHVPEDVIRASHQGAAANFFQLKDTPGIESAKFYDNTDKEPRLIYEKVEGKEAVHDTARFERYRHKSQGLSEDSPLRRNGFRSFPDGPGRGRIEEHGGQAESQAQSWISTSELLEA